MGNDYMGGNRMREVANQFAGSLPRMFGCRLGSAESVKDGIPKERATGQGVIMGWSKVRCPRCLNGLCLWLRIRWGEEFDGPFLDGSIHRER